MEDKWIEQRLHLNPRPTVSGTSTCPLASALATSSHFLRLLAASGPESETLLINLMPFAPSEYAHQDFTPLGFLDRIYVYSDTFLDRVAGLYLVLEDIAHNASERQLNDKQKKDLSLLINGASSILEELSVLIQRHESLGNEPLMIKSKVEKAWKKVRWDQNVIRDLRFRIISSMTTLDAFNSSLTSEMSQKMSDSIALLDERLGDLQLDKDQRDRQDLLEWISPLNFPSQQNAIFNRRQEGTGQWFFESPEVKTWLSRPGQTLLCTGIPGAGKTMLASMAIDHLQHMFHQKNIPVAYIYCDYKRQKEQSPVNLFASILKQLLQNIDLLPESVMRSYRHHARVKTRPELKEIYDMLTSLLADFSQTFIIVDALDELTVYAQVRQIFLSNLRSLQKIQDIHFMMTSRFIPTEVHDFQNILRLEIRASDYDIQRYVYGHMSDLTLSVQSNSKLQETIVASIVNAVDGMFLLAQLHVESLTDRTTPKAVKSALETLPTGSDALNFAYSQAMQRVEAQKPGFRSLAKQALSWVVHAYRLLTAKELCHALAIEIGESVFDEEGLNDIEEIVSVCCGLITIDPETTAVRLVHYTTQEYFKRAGSEHFPNAKEDIATRCLTYLLFDEFETGRIRKYSTLYPMPEVSTLQARLRKYAFLEYAACFWARHAEDYTTNLKHRVSILLAQFIADDYKVSSATQVVLHVNRDWSFYQCHSPTPVSGIHLATYFNLSHTVSHMLEIGLFAADVEDCNGETPLVLAARKGNEATLEVLLRRPDVDVNNSTPLALAAKHASLGI